MKDIAKFIAEQNQVNEALETIKGRVYSVAVIGCEDEEGIPMTLKIVLEEPTRHNVRAVENWLTAQEGDTFSHAEGGNIEY